MGIRLEVLRGIELAAVLDDVARLRIAVFWEWPYLYDGDFEYERQYLQSYQDSDGAVVVGAFDGDRLIGAATGTPMSDHAEEFAAAFDGMDIDLCRVFYCAESVLLPDYRGQGIGHWFFDLREAHARELGFDHVAFCAVQRGADHPLRPSGYRPLDGFWRKRGYTLLDGVEARFEWLDREENAPTIKPLQFWMRRL